MPAETKQELPQEFLGLTFELRHKTEESEGFLRILLCGNVVAAWAGTLGHEGDYAVYLRPSLESAKKLAAKLYHDKKRGGFSSFQAATEIVVSKASMEGLWAKDESLAKRVLSRRVR